MSRSLKFLSLAAAVLAVFAVVAIPALAQDEPPTTVTAVEYPQNTITVVGTGTVHAAPDIASVDVGVDVTQPAVSDAFTQANTTLQAIIDALTALGIAPEDIQTSNLSVYSTTNFNSETGNNDKGYTVSNVVNVIVRDVTQVEAVIDAAINAGATSLYGLSFDISDRAALETQAREQAIQDAQARAAEYASLIGAELGDVIIVAETQFGGVQPFAFESRAQGMGGGGAVVAPGQSDVQIQVSVTYSISR